MPTIQNISKAEAFYGQHSPADVMISINDPLSFPPVTKMPKHVFHFADADEADEHTPEDWLFTQEQAKYIIAILKDALINNHNVVVHCHAGICRSGAVAEVAQIMGFQPIARHRQPTLRVKHKLLKQLGLTYERTS